MKMRSKTGLIPWLLTLTLILNLTTVTATCGFAAEIPPAPVPTPPKIGGSTPAPKPVAKPVESAPTPAVWEPVRLALSEADTAEESTAAQAQLSELLTRYPNWADGHKTLAKVLLDQGKAAEALVSAKRAWALAPADDQALRMQVRALAELGRKAAVYALVEGAVTKDATGWVRYEAGLAAVGFHDEAKAEAYLKEAKSRVGAKIPAEFLFLESRVAILARDFPRAELALSSATVQQADFWDGWYELGRVRLVLADQVRAQRASWISKAAEAFAVVVKALPEDPNGHIGLGRAALEEAKMLSADSQDDRAASKLRDAVVQLEHALEKAPDTAEALILMGDAQLRLEQWPEAVAALQRATVLGAKDRGLTFNLAIALQQTGNNEAAQALLKTVTAANPDEQVTIGMGAYRSRNWLLAVHLLSSAVDGLSDIEAKAAVWRFIGHAHAHLADAKTDNGKTDSAAERDAASEAFRQAGALADFPARRFYFASEAARSPEHAYAAAWQMMRWDFLTPGAWAVAIGNYGAAKTGGQGLAGMATRAPLHLAAWSALIVLPLLFFIVGLFRRGRGKLSAPSAQGMPSSGTQAPAPRPARGPKNATTVVPPGSPSRAKSTERGALVKPSGIKTSRPEAHQKSETEPIENPVPRMKQKAETVAMAANKTPQVKPIMRRPSLVMPPSTGLDDSDPALERRKS